MARREDVIALLARSVRDKLITMEQARAILATFDAGRDVSLPLAPVEAIRPGRDIAIAVALAALSVRGVPAVELIASGPATATLPARSLFAELRDTARTRFHATATNLADDLSNGKITVAEWQARMSDEIDGLLTRMTYLGRGDSLIPAAERAALDATLAREQAFLSRFADQIATREALGTPMSFAQIAARSQQYSGSAYGQWFAAKERRDSDPNAVVFYRARDDGSTCSPCLDAQDGSPYLPGDGPMPGQICLGGGHCRCIRETIIDAAAYRRLVSGA